MANNIEIREALVKIIEIYKDTNFLMELKKLYNSYKIQSKNINNPAFLEICANELWEDFTSNQMSFLHSFDVVKYMGKPSGETLQNLVTKHFRDENKIYLDLKNHHTNAEKAIDRCSNLLNALNDYHFEENKEFPLIFENLEALNNQLQKMFDFLAEKFELTEEEIKNLKDEMNKLKESLKDKEDSIKEDPDYGKYIVETFIKEALKKFIKDPKKLSNIFFFLTQKGLELKEQMMPIIEDTIKRITF